MKKLTTKESIIGTDGWLNIKLHHLKNAVVHKQPITTYQIDNSFLNREKAIYFESEPETLVKQRTITRKIALPTKKGYNFATLSEIIRIEGEANYSTFHFAQREKLLITKCLGTYEKLLESDYFCRTHKRHIVNLQYVTSFERGRYSTISLENGHSVPLSYSRRDQFMHMLKLETIF